MSSEPPATPPPVVAQRPRRAWLPLAAAVVVAVGVYLGLRRGAEVRRLTASFTELSHSHGLRLDLDAWGTTLCLGLDGGKELQAFVRRQPFDARLSGAGFVAAGGLCLAQGLQRGVRRADPDLRVTAVFWIEDPDALAAWARHGATLTASVPGRRVLDRVELAPVAIPASAFAAAERGRR